MVNEFIYTQPVKIYFGIGQYDKIGEILKSLGLSRPLIVCGGHFADRAGELEGRLGREHAQVAVCGIFSDICENPQLSGVEEIARLAREQEADALVAIGGGSVMDSAKFAAAIANDGGDACEYYNGTRAFPSKHIPVIALPTTAGTGSEVTQVSVISRDKEKKTINDPAFMPLAAIVDPMLCISVPPRTTMNTGLDALSHALEGFWSIHHQPICDLMSTEAVRLILTYLERAYRDGKDMGARCAMSYASLLGGLSFSCPKTAGCHACSYPLSEDYHLPHGEACAFTLDSFVRINADNRLEELCRNVGLRDTEELASRIADLKRIGWLRTRLCELENVNIEKLCHDCAVHPLMNNNPVHMDEKALYNMFEALK